VEFNPDVNSVEVTHSYPAIGESSVVVQDDTQEWMQEANFQDHIARHEKSHPNPTVVVAP
jgi:hypothetical protein